jgi:pSer/pThr/pTyr-binding forkhead associated (FHA) protein
MFTFNALQGIPGNLYILLALLAAVCILLVALLLLLLRGSKRAAVNSDGHSSAGAYLHKQVQHVSQKLWYQQSLQDQAHEDLGSRAQLPPPHNIHTYEPVPELADENNNSSGTRQPLQPLSTHELCPLCGKVIQPSDMFCMNCGNRLKMTSPRLASGKRPVVRGVLSSSADGPSLASSSASSSAVNTWSSTSLQEKTFRDPNTVAQKLARGLELPGHLTLRSGDKNLRDYPLDKTQMYIGRSTNNDIMISKDKLTSRHHAIISYENEHYALLDDHSANGTYLNGRKIVTVSPHPLNDGDVIKIGVNEFIFHIIDVQSFDIDDAPTLAVEPTSSAQDMKSASAEDPLQRMVTDIHQPVVERHSTPLPPLTPPVPTTDAPVEVASQQMAFTAFHPKEVPADLWNTLLVYAYQNGITEAIYEDADRFRQELVDVPSGLSSPLAQPLLTATNITIVPECKGVVFNPRRLSFKWTDNWHRSMFRFSIKQEMLGADTSGRINIFAGPLLIATLRMSMMFTAQTQPELVSGAEATTQAYTRVFASYNKQDTAIAQAYSDVSRVLGIDVQQREALRSCEPLHDSVKQAIEEAEVFQLFWSSQSAQSVYIKQEWQYALELQRSEDFLHPIYWDVPLLTAPAPLAALQFTYLPLYTFLK